MWTIISGTGFENFNLFEEIETICQETPFGQASSGVRRLKLSNQELIFIPRHAQKLYSTEQLSIQKWQVS